MATHMSLLKRVVAKFRGRDWFGVGIELFTVVLGVLLGLQAAQWTAAKQERAYRDQVAGALQQSLADFYVHGARIEQAMIAKATEFERARVAGQRPSPPVYRESGGERPPTEVWHAVVATGVARTIEPRLLFRFASFYSRAENFGERYIRYNQFSETQVLPYLETPAHFYDGANLRPEYAAYIERLRDLSQASARISDDARRLQRDLKAMK